jgi:hypothetical protein
METDFGNNFRLFSKLKPDFVGILQDLWVADSSPQRKSGSI